MMRKKRKFFIQMILCCFLLSFTIFSNYFPVYAASSDSAPEKVTEAESGVVHLLLSCTTPDGETYYIRQGTGFIGGTNDGKQYILTTDSVVNASKQELSQIRKWAGISQETALTTQVSILTDPDILLTATVASVGSDVPYAILTCEQTLTQASALPYELDENIKRSQSAYLYGYDTDSSLLGTTAPPDTAAVLRSGTITEVTSSPFSFSCDLDAGSGCAGAPLLSEDGYVLGMFYENGDTLDILPGSTLMELLDTLNISYQTSATANNYNVADDALKAELASLLTECQNDVTEHADEYSSKSLLNYKTAISTAMQTIADSSSSKDQYQSALDSLQSAKKKLKPKNYTLRIVQLVLLGVLTFLGLLNLKQYMKTRSLSLTLHPERRKNNPTIDDNEKAAVLIRSNTNEVIRLNRSELRIGCDDKKVDYTITGNPAISHYHAAIIRKGNDFYLMDNHSTNHTRINNTFLSPDKPCKLNDSDFILLADEPFVFRFVEE